jgi:hypothetical protein
MLNYQRVAGRVQHEYTFNHLCISSLVNVNYTTPAYKKNTVVPAYQPECLHTSHSSYLLCTQNSSQGYRVFCNIPASHPIIPAYYLLFLHITPEFLTFFPTVLGIFFNSSLFSVYRTSSYICCRSTVLEDCSNNPHTLSYFFWVLCTIFSFSSIVIYPALPA